MEHIGTLIDDDVLDQSPLDDGGDGGDASDGTPENPDGDGGDGGGYKGLTPIVEVRTPMESPGRRGSAVVVASPSVIPALPYRVKPPPRRVARDPSERISSFSSSDDRPGMGSDQPPSVDRFMLGRDPTERFTPVVVGAVAGADEENQGPPEKTDEELAAEARGRRNRRAALCLAFLLVVLAAVLGAVFGTRSGTKKTGDPSRNVDGEDDDDTAVAVVPGPGSPTSSPIAGGDANDGTVIDPETGEEVSLLEPCSALFDGPCRPTPAPSPYRLEYYYDGPFPGECRDADGRAYGAIRINLGQVAGVDSSALGCGRVCGTMPLPGLQVGFQYGPTGGYGFDCRCLYEAGALVEVTAVPGEYDWPREPGDGGTGRPAAVAGGSGSGGVVCHPARTPSEAPSGSPSALVDWGWITVPEPATAAPTASPVTRSPLPEGVSFLSFLEYVSFRSPRPSLRRSPAPSRSCPFIHLSLSQVTAPPTGSPTQSPLAPSASPTPGPSGSPTAYCPSLNKKQCTKSPICVRAESAAGEEICIAGTYAPTGEFRVREVGGEEKGEREGRIRRLPKLHTRCPPLD